MSYDEKVDVILRDELKREKRVKKMFKERMQKNPKDKARLRAQRKARLRKMRKMFRKRHFRFFDSEEKHKGE